MPTIRQSDREDMAARQKELSGRLQALRQESERNRARIVELQAQAQEDDGNARVAAHELEQAQAKNDAAQTAKRRTAKNLEVLNEQQLRVAGRIKEANAELAELERTAPAQRPGAQVGRGASVDEAIAIAARYGTFGDKDMAAALKTSIREARKIIGVLVVDGRLNTGRKMLGQQMYDYVPTAEDQAATIPEAKQVGRDWIVAQAKPFTRIQLKQAAELTDEETEAVIQWAMERGIVSNIGVEGSEILQYAPPTGPGKAAVVDMERRRHRDRGPGSEAIAGTGRGLTVNDPDVRALVSACERLGASVKKAGDGHLKIEYMGRSVNIASTPSTRRTVLNDRARVRRQLGLKLAT